MIDPPDFIYYDPDDPGGEAPEFVADPSAIPIEPMPTENAAEFFEWLKKRHSAEYIDSLPTDKPRPNHFNYAGITVDQVETAMGAIQKQRAGDTDIMRQLLAELSPIEIISLAKNPHQLLRTEKELFELDQLEIADEVDRFKKMPEAGDIAEPTPRGVSKYFHSTPLAEVAEKIIENGLHCNEFTGLDATAVILGPNQEENFRSLATRHRRYQFLVVVVLPALPEWLVDKMWQSRSASGRINKDHLFSESLAEKIDRHGAGLNYDSLIPPRYIEGYFDCSTGQYVKNTEFNPSLTQLDIQALNHRLEELTKPSDPLPDQGGQNRPRRPRPQYFS